MSKPIGEYMRINENLMIGDTSMSLGDISQDITNTKTEFDNLIKISEYGIIDSSLFTKPSTGSAQYTLNFKKKYTNEPSVFAILNTRSGMGYWGYISVRIRSCTNTSCILGCSINDITTGGKTWIAYVVISND